MNKKIKFLIPFAVQKLPDQIHYVFLYGTCNTYSQDVA